MKKQLSLFILLTFFCSVNLKAQSNLQKDIIGLWKAVKIYDIGAVIPSDIKPQIEIIQKKLIGSRFHFKADKTFSFESSLKEMNIPNGYWKIQPDNNQVIIEEKKENAKPNSVLMGITVLQKDGKTIFMLEETFFSFEVIKVGGEN